MCSPVVFKLTNENIGIIGTCKYLCLNAAQLPSLWSRLRLTFTEWKG